MRTGLRTLSFRSARKRCAAVAPLAAVLAVCSTSAASAPPKAAPPTDGAPPPIEWQVGLTPAGDDDVNVSARAGKMRIRTPGKRFANSGRHRAFGSVTFRPRLLDTAVNRVRTAVRARVPPGASLETQVRGRTSRGWTEWNEVSGHSPAVFPRRVSRVQARLILRGDRQGRSPVVSGVTLSADSVPTRRQTSAEEARTYTVFATREGLVGKTTANGHVVERRDHFVALPTSRSLSPAGEGDYSAKVCSPDTGRCAFAPVWDVGPWNVHDDYWNRPSVRENWSELPQGVPEAEAAFRDGYNGGKDGFGRTVLNPAGIDLADGTFWDGVGLSDNAWVDVTYLWTGTYPATGTIGTQRTALRIRAEPTTEAADVGRAGQYARVPILCQTHGEKVRGYYGTSDLWNKVGPGMFVPDAYTHTGSDSRVAPPC